MKKKTVKDINPSGKRVLVRCDFNVPMSDGHITDDRRIVESLPTIKYLIEHGARVILMSHLGRPKGPDPKSSLKPIADRLTELLGQPVQFINDCIGGEVLSKAMALKNGEVLLLENVRFYPEEEKNDPAFAQELAKAGEMYVNDAFGSAHRAHASTEGVTHILHPSVGGFLMESELHYLVGLLQNPKRPLIGILGGAKVSGKIDVITNLIGKFDALLIGGGMAFTFYRAQGRPTGKSLVEEDKIELANSILAKCSDSITQLHLPSDHISIEEFKNEAPSRIMKTDEFDGKWMGVDIGPLTIDEYTKIIQDAQTIFWNGPLGVFEMPSFANGTRAIAEAIVERTKDGAISVIGGGDSAAAVQEMGLAEGFSHVSTGGGASLELMEGRQLPGVVALDDA